MYLQYLYVVAVSAIKIARDLRTQGEKIKLELKGMVLCRRIMDHFYKKQSQVLELNMFVESQRKLVDLIKALKDDEEMLSVSMLLEPLPETNILQDSENIRSMIQDLLKDYPPKKSSENRTELRV